MRAYPSYLERFVQTDDLDEGLAVLKRRPGQSESDASHIAVTGLSVHSSIATKSEATMTRKKGVPRRAGALVATLVDWESGIMKYRDTVPAWITENAARHRTGPENDEAEFLK
jgi:hypothetical protein